MREATGQTESAGGGGLAVFVHGLHADAPGWRDVCFGVPPGRMGRGPTAVRAALDLRARHLVFGLGGAKSSGRYHPDRMHRDLLDALPAKLGGAPSGETGGDGLDAFPALRGRGAEVRDLLTTRCVFAPDANASTTGELQGLLPLLEVYGYAGVVLVSSPDHLPRCLRDAHAVLGGRGLAIHGVMSDVAMGTRPPVVIEQPHRPDRDASDLRDFAAGLLALPPAARRALVDEMTPRLAARAARELE